MARLVHNVFNVFTNHVHKLKQCINLRLHDENYASIAVSLLVQKMGGGGGEVCFCKCFHMLNSSNGTKFPIETAFKSPFQAWFVYRPASTIFVFYQDRNLKTK